MSIADFLAAITFLTVIIYAIFGGADFGSGVWDLTAGSSKGGWRTRRLVDHAIGPVWEANHVWLIFVIVLLFGGFPAAFTDLMTTMAVPWWLAALGIVARGAGFAFRKYAPTLAAARIAGVIFAVSSLATPFFLGAIAGAVASGRVSPAAAAESGVAWLSPTSILGGVLAVATCTFLAGVFLTAEATSLGDDELAEELRRKSLIGGAVTGVVAAAGIPVLIADAPVLVDGLVGPGLAAIVASTIAGLTTMWLLATRRLRRARLGATIAVGAVVAGWGLAQYPWMLVDHLTIEQAAGARTSVLALSIAAVVAVVLVVPALVLLFVLSEQNRVGVDR